MTPVFYKAIQVIVAILVLFALLTGALAVMKQDGLISDPSKNVSTYIIKGWVDTSGFTDKQFDTYNQFATNYRKLPHSVNKKGGAQFSYTMWAKFNDLSDENVANKVLFMHGDKTNYPYSVAQGQSSKQVSDYIVKCPLIKFGDTADTLEVHVNTSDDLNTTATIARIPSSDDTMRHNIFSLIPGKWVLLTYTFEDHVAHGVADGVEFKFYVNDVLYHTETLAGHMRLNQGQFHILTNGSQIQGGMMADLMYHNYALGMKDVSRILARGFNNVRYNEMENDPSFNQPLYLSQYNKLEINNN